MVREQRDRNIFETVSKKLGKKNPSTQKTPPPQPIQREQAPVQQEAEGKILDPEIKTMLKRIHEMKADLAEKMRILYEQGSKYRVDVDKYLSNPKIFPQWEMEKVLKDNEDLINKVHDAISPAVSVKKPSKSRETLAKERKGKTLGPRKKWIPVR